YAHDVDGLEVDLAVRGGNSEEWAFVSAVIGLVSGHPIAVCELPMNLGMEVGECLSHVGVELPDARLVGGGSGLGGVIHEIVREELFEGGEVACPLNLLGIAPNDSFCRLRRRVVPHRLRPLPLPVLPRVRSFRGPAASRVYVIGSRFVVQKAVNRRPRGSASPN